MEYLIILFYKLQSKWFKYINQINVSLRNDRASISETCKIIICPKIIIFVNWSQSGSSLEIHLLITLQWNIKLKFNFLMLRRLILLDIVFVFSLGRNLDLWLKSKGAPLWERPVGRDRVTHLFKCYLNLIFV